MSKEERPSLDGMSPSARAKALYHQALDVLDQDNRELAEIAFSTRPTQPE